MFTFFSFPLPFAGATAITPRIEEDVQYVLSPALALRSPMALDAAGWAEVLGSLQATHSWIYQVACSSCYLNQLGGADSSKGRVQCTCAGRTPDKAVSAPESKSPHLHGEHGDCSGECRKGRRWCFSTLIKINRAADAVCAAASAWGWAELFYFYSLGINTPHPFLFERGRLWLTKSLNDLNFSAE